MLHGGAFQVCQDVTKTGNEKRDQSVTKCSQIRKLQNAR